MTGGCTGFARRGVGSGAEADVVVVGALSKGAHDGDGDALVLRDFDGWSFMAFVTPGCCRSVELRRRGIGRQSFVLYQIPVTGES